MIDEKVLLLYLLHLPFPKLIHHCLYIGLLLLLVFFLLCLAHNIHRPHVILRLLLSSRLSVIIVLPLSQRKKKFSLSLLLLLLPRLLLRHPSLQEIRPLLKEKWQQQELYEIARVRLMMYIQPTPPDLQERKVLPGLPRGQLRGVLRWC